MSLKCGIVGLPNVGKSTLFNALTNTMAAEAANYPFCTIEPNVGRVGVNDERLDKLAEIASSEKVIPTQIEFVDIAGLVKGASKGDGLGNKFLGNIREVDAIVYVLRCFDNEDIVHVEGTVNPIRDAEIIETEILLADIESLQKRIQNLEKKSKNDAVMKDEAELLKRILTTMEQGITTKVFLQQNSIIPTKDLQILSAKPCLYVCNVGEDGAAHDSSNAHVKKVEEYAQSLGAKCITISAQLEAELSQLSQEEKLAFLNEAGLSNTGLDKLVMAAYETLGLITFFTVGPKEARAWTISNGLTAPKAAGVIHTDFERGFIKAETISYNDYIICSGESQARDTGKLRMEGKEYVVQDGDVMHFKFNV